MTDRIFPISRSTAPGSLTSSAGLGLSSVGSGTVGVAFGGKTLSGRSGPWKGFASVKLESANSVAAERSARIWFRKSRERATSGWSNPRIRSCVARTVVKPSKASSSRPARK